MIGKVRGRATGCGPARRKHEMQSHHVSLNGQPFHYLEWGPADAPMWRNMPPASWWATWSR